MFKRIVVALMIAGLAGCSSAPAVEQTASSVENTAVSMVSDPAQITTSLQEMINTDLSGIDTSVSAGDIEAAKAAFAEFEETWEVIEDGLKDISPEAYESIETAMEGVEDALVRADAPDAATVQAATAALRSTLEAFIATQS